MYMRRAGLDWETIIKITGHKDTVNIVKFYDLKLEAQGDLNLLNYIVVMTDNFKVLRMSPLQLGRAHVSPRGKFLTLLCLRTEVCVVEAIQVL